MTQQNGDTGRQTPERVSSTYEFERVWDNLGQGGKVILTLCTVILVYSFFFNGNSFTELSEIDVVGEERDKLVKYLEEENIDFRYTEEGVVRIPSNKVSEVYGFLDRFVKVEQESTIAAAAATPVNLPDLTNFRLGSFNRSTNRLEKKIKATEAEIARYDGIDSISIVPNRLATERQSFDRAPSFNRVTVQVELEENRRSIGLGSDMIKLIKSHVSAAMDIPISNIQMFDLSGRSYDFVDRGFTAADIRQKAGIVENRVADFMANILPLDSFRIQVDVGAPTLPASVNGDEVIPELRQINDRIIQLTPVTAPLPEDVVTITALQNAQSKFGNSNLNNPEISNVAVTVFIDREPARAVLDREEYERRLSFDPVISIPPQESFQSITRDIAIHLEDHLRATFPEDSVTARLVPVNLIGANGQLADSSWVSREFFVPAAANGNSSQSSTIFFFALVSFLFVVLMFRDGPKDAENRYSIKGFHGGIVERSVPSFTSGNGFATGVTPGEDPVIVQQIVQKSFEERIEVLRAIVRNGAENLPGSGVLALMIFDLSENRQDFFTALTEEECSVLFELVDGIVAPIAKEEIEDAFAAFELINKGLANGNDIPVLVTTVPTRPQIDQKVIEDIRSTNPALADVISKNREGADREKRS
ncbi:MAG: hypothetical protein CBC13_09740 [Planctomycetia bacterium TMED53]|nr:MAG: hypothetical protein CBC13_09740 [Planctomycetia bacterium TMED53]